MSKRAVSFGFNDTRSSITTRVRPPSSNRNTSAWSYTRHSGRTEFWPRSVRKYRNRETVNRQTRSVDSTGRANRLSGRAYFSKTEISPRRVRICPEVYQVVRTVFGCDASIVIRTLKFSFFLCPPPPCSRAYGRRTRSISFVRTRVHYPKRPV